LFGINEGDLHVSVGKGAFDKAILESGFGRPESFKKLFDGYDNRDLIGVF
jgi:hypothetical protein